MNKEGLNQFNKVYSPLFYQGIASNRGNGNSPFSFAWITDFHIDRVGTYSAGEPEDAFNRIATNHSDIDFVLATGDLVENARLSEYDNFESKRLSSLLSSKTWYILPGNHDEKTDSDPSGGTADGPADYIQYDAKGYPRRWAFSHKGYKFIGFTAFVRRLPDALSGMADVSATDLSFVQTELESKGSDIPILICHFPVSNLIGNNIRGTAQTQLLNLMTTHNCYVYLSGHKHIDFVNRISGVVNNINGECLAYSVPNTTGSFMIVSVNGKNITFDTYLRKSPWTLQDSLTITIP